MTRRGVYSSKLGKERIGIGDFQKNTVRYGLVPYVPNREQAYRGDRNTFGKVGSATEKSVPMNERAPKVNLSNVQGS